MNEEQSNPRKTIFVVVDNVFIEFSVKGVANKIAAKADQNHSEAEEYDWAFEQLCRKGEKECVPPFEPQIKGELLHISLEQQNEEETNKVELSEKLWYSKAKENFEDQGKRKECNDRNRDGNQEKVGAAWRQTQRTVTVFIGEGTQGW